MSVPSKSRLFVLNGPGVREWFAQAARTPTQIRVAVRVASIDQVFAFGAFAGGSADALVAAASTKVQFTFEVDPAVRRGFFVSELREGPRA